MSSEERTIESEKFYSKLDIPLTSLQGAREAIEVNRHTDNVVCLVGAAGVGKTHLIQQVARDRKPQKPFTWHGVEYTTSVPMKVLYLAHMQAEDMGVPYPSRAKRNERLRECELFMRVAEMSRNGLGEKARAYALQIAQEVLDGTSTLDNGTFEFLVEKQLKDLPPEGILFLDEWNRADKSVIKAFFTIIEDHAVHGHNIIPDGVQIVAAMNPSDGAYSVNEAEKDHAFRRRLSFIAVTCNTGAWLTYAASAHFHEHVIDFVQSLPAALYDDKLRDAGKVFPCPATWEKVSTVLKTAASNKVPLTASGVQLSVCGHIGQATGSQFMDYVQNNEVIINPEDILDGYLKDEKLKLRISKLIEKGRNDALGELCTGLAVVLMTKQPKVDKISKNLAHFMGDLHTEIATSFIVHSLTAAMEGVEGAETYLNDLSAALVQHKPYQDMFERISNAMDNAEKEVASDKEKTDD